MGQGGAFLLMLQLFLAVTSTGNSEQMAVASLFSYDVYRQYFNPQASNEKLLLVSRIMVGVYAGAQMAWCCLCKVDQASGLLLRCIVEHTYFAREHFCLLLASQPVLPPVLLLLLPGTHACAPGFLTRAVISGVIAIILLEIGLNLGWVYLVMGIIIGSAVFPLAACITWKKCSAVAAVTSSLVSAWMICVCPRISLQPAPHPPSLLSLLSLHYSY